MGRMPWVLRWGAVHWVGASGLVVGGFVDFGSFESSCSGGVDPVSELLHGDVVIWWCTACDLCEVGC